MDESNHLSRAFHTQWIAARDGVNMYLDALSDEELRTEIISGKNHGVWVLGHLVASDDTLTEYLGYGPVLFPETQQFAQSKSPIPIEECPAPAILRKEWQKVCEKNDVAYGQLTDNDLEKLHAMVKENLDDDYFKTKQGVIINWTLHQIHHAGQLALLLAKFDRRLV